MASLRRCKRCGEYFVPGLFGINLFMVRIRKCSHCGKLTPVYLWGDREGPKIEEDHQQEELISEEEMLKRRIEESKYAKR